VHHLVKRLDYYQDAYYVRVNWSDMFSIKNILGKVYILLPLFFSFGGVYKTRVQKNQMT
jgi:hypothetical protein